MARRVGLVVADEAIEPRPRAGIDQSHPVQPVAERPAYAFDTRDVAVHHETIDASRQVLGIVPAGELDLLRLGWILAVCRCRIGVASVRAHQPVHEQLEHARHLVPVDGRHDDDAVRRGEALVDLGHPVVFLAEAVIGVARARPVAQRHCRRNAPLAWVDVELIVGRDEAQVEEVDFDMLGLHDFRHDQREPECLRNLAGARAVVARRPIDDENARRRRRAFLSQLRARQCGRASGATRPKACTRDRRTRARRDACAAPCVPCGRRPTRRPRPWRGQRASSRTRDRRTVPRIACEIRSAAGCRPPGPCAPWSSAPLSHAWKPILDRAGSARHRRGAIACRTAAMRGRRRSALRTVPAGALLRASRSSASTSEASAVAHDASTLMSNSASARVRPRLIAAMGRSRCAARSQNRNPEYTISDEPTTSIASARCSASKACSTRGRGTLSPKKTTAGLSVPPHCAQDGTRNASRSAAPGRHRRRARSHLPRRQSVGCRFPSRAARRRGGGTLRNRGSPRGRALREARSPCRCRRDSEVHRHSA